MDNEKHLYILGLGLIGGSVAGGLRDSPYRVTGWDQVEEYRQGALERNLVEDVHPPDELPESVSGVILAIPVPEMVPVTETLLEADYRPEFITDVGSTKQQVCEAMKELLPEDLPFIGAHPMAGSEDSGLEASDPILFENAICVLTPTDPDHRYLLDVINIWETLGAHVVEMHPREHDQTVAHVSHLPHLNAAALLQGVRSVDQYEETLLPLAAGGFRDTTRVAEGDPDLWRDIFETNRDQVLDAVDNFISVLEDARNHIEDEDWSGLTEWLDEARKVRDRIPEKTKGLLGTLFELKILAPDEPGIIAHITGVLAEESINISDIEVLRVREGERGSIRLGFRQREELEKAREVLSETNGDIEMI